MNDLRKIHPWFLQYMLHKTRRVIKPAYRKQKHVFLCLCDHYEPLWGNAGMDQGLKRVELWHKKYPETADRFRDSDGHIPKYTFFYPVEEYRHEYLSILADLQKQGYGEVEIHLHHDNDTPDKLKKTLIDFKRLLSERYKLLCRDKNTGEIKYGFIHGNWSLDNSGRMCGVNNELDILQETGCYADFTMPSAPHATQTTKINSIYYAIDDPDKPKSHNWGYNAKKGNNVHKGLLMVQGPLMLNWNNRKWGFVPRIENSCVGADYKITAERIQLWLDADIHLEGRPDCVFVKLYTHGTQEDNSAYLFETGFNNLFTSIQEYCEEKGCELHYITARELVNIVRAIEDNINAYSSDLRDYRYI